MAQDGMDSGGARALSQRTTEPPLAAARRDVPRDVEHAEAGLCEPGIVRSPDGRQLAMLLRENSRRFNSYVSFSDDAGGSLHVDKDRRFPENITLVNAAYPDILALLAEQERLRGFACARPCLDEGVEKARPPSRGAKSVAFPGIGRL